MWGKFIVAVAMFIVFTFHNANLQAQVADNAWVRQTQQQIEQHRQGEVRFIVLDATGKPAKGAEVRVKQLSHAFEIGLTLQGSPPASYDADAQVWRVFNSASLAGMSGWRQVQPESAESFRGVDLDKAIGWAQEQNLSIAWGALFTADAADLPDWVVPLKGEALRDASLVYMREVLKRYRPWLDRLVLCADTQRHDRYSPAILRLLRLKLDALAPNIKADLSYTNALDKRSTVGILDAADTAAKDFIGHDGVSLLGKVSGQLRHQDVIRTIGRIAVLDQPIIITRLEVGGPTAVDRTLNAETLFRTLFAEPRVKGIYFNGVLSDELRNRDAALIDAEGKPTGIGQSLDQLFTETWWTDNTATTDDVGNAKIAAYFGQYKVSVKLSDGSNITAEFALRPEDPSPLIVLQPISR